VRSLRPSEARFLRDPRSRLAAGARAHGGPSAGLADQWRAIQQSLPEGWADLRLRLTVADAGDCDRAAALLSPANPGRRGKVVSFRAARRGQGPSPQLVRRLLARLDAEKINGELEIVGSSEAVATAAAEPQQFVPAWEAELTALPEDWSDLYVRLDLESSDYTERAALLLAPVNPARWKADARAESALPEGGASSDSLSGKPAFRFRCARAFGYGASPEMTRRCLARLDEEGIRGSLRVLWAVSDAKPVQTQGPVWYVGGGPV
jgi:hypothetical protein